MTHQCPDCDVTMIDEGTIGNYSHLCPECKKTFVLLEIHHVWSIKEVHFDL